MSPKMVAALTFVKKNRIALSLLLPGSDQSLDCIHDCVINVIVFATDSQLHIHLQHHMQLRYWLKTIGQKTPLFSRRTKRMDEDRRRM